MSKTYILEKPIEAEFFPDIIKNDFDDINDYEEWLEENELEYSIELKDGLKGYVHKHTFEEIFVELDVEQLQQKIGEAIGDSVYVIINEILFDIDRSQLSESGVEQVENLLDRVSTEVLAVLGIENNKKGQ